MILRKTKTERRSGPDLWVKALSWFGVFGWLLMFAALCVVDKAKPESEAPFARFFNVNLRTTWDTSWTIYLFYLMIIGVSISIIGFIINTKRHHREEDRYRITFILLGVISIFGIVKFLFF